MTKDRWALIGYSLVVIVAVVLISNNFLATRDVSWISTLEGYLDEETWEPDIEYVPIASWAFFLCENETEQFFVSKSRVELISVVNALMDDIDRQVHDSISEELLEEALSHGKMLEIVHRFSTKFKLWTPPNSFAMKVDYDLLYFVLEDNSKNGLEGTIIVREHSFGAEQSNYSVWQISKGFLG